MSRSILMPLVVSVLTLGIVRADGLIYQYEGDLLPYDPDAGWIVFSDCHPDCVESLEKGCFVVEWPVEAETANYHLWIAQPPNVPPPNLWVEWRFHSNQPKPPTDFGCDGHFVVNYKEVVDLVNMFADWVVSFSGDDFLRDLDPNEFRTYRFESLDGVEYSFAVDGVILKRATDFQGNAYHYLQFGGHGGCRDGVRPVTNRWDYIRYGTISQGEQVIATQPAEGFVSARDSAPLDRFAVTFDAPNYIYLDEIGVTIASGEPPIVTKTRRRDNDGPETLEIVLDRPIPMSQTTTFTLNDGVAVNVIEYTFAPGDTDGDGLVTLIEMQDLQNCFGSPASSSGACLALDLQPDEAIDNFDFSELVQLFAGPLPSD